MIPKSKSWNGRHDTCSKGGLERGHCSGGIAWDLWEQSDTSQRNHSNCLRALVENAGKEFPMELRLTAALLCSPAQEIS